MKRVGAFLLLAFIAGCADSHTDTSVRLAVKYEAKWGLTGLVLSVDKKVEPAEVKGHFLVTLPDAWDGKSVEIELDGMKDGERWAFGKTTVTVAKNKEVKAEVVLTRLPCGEWCTEGMTSCSGDGVVTCAQRDDDDCMEWTDAIPCGGDTPYCSLGFCSDTCVDECAKGEVQCAGPAGYQECGSNDLDDCNDWLPVAACDGDQVCSGSACSDTCQSVCDDGDAQCRGAGTSACGDLNGDDCTEWGPIEPCGADQSCTNGECVDGCEDECSETTCSGTTLSQCGQFDFDECLDLSPGSSCVAADACEEGQCSETAGCMITPRICDDPPAAECADDDTLRTYAAVGECTEGTCDYAPTDFACTEGCSGTACTCTEEITTVESGATSSNVSIGVDSSGIVSLGYDNNFDFKYARRAANGTWTKSTIDEDVTAIPSPQALAVDAIGVVHTAYYDGTNVALKYAYRPTFGGWSIYTIDSEAGWEPAIAAGEMGNVHIAYAGYFDDSTDSNLRYAGYENGTWTKTVVDSTGDVGWHPAIAVDATGLVHVVYFDGINGKLKYARRSANGTWTTSAITAASDAYDATVALGVDSSGVLHATYWVFEPQQSSLMYARRDVNGVWTTVTVDNQGGQDSSLKIDASGVVHVSYRDQAHNVKYARRATNGTWNIRILDHEGVGGPTALAIDNAGIVHIAYKKGSTSEVLYAKVCP